MKRAATERHHHRMFHVLARLFRFIVGEMIRSLAEFVVSSAVLEGIVPDARAERCRAAGLVIGPVSAVVGLVGASLNCGHGLLSHNLRLLLLLGARARSRRRCSGRPGGHVLGHVASDESNDRRGPGG
jgi:hypothetical protein